jgi:hypothetical protein
VRVREQAVVRRLAARQGELGLDDVEAACGIDLDALHECDAGVLRRVAPRGRSRAELRDVGRVVHREHRVDQAFVDPTSAVALVLVLRTLGARADRRREHDVATFRVDHRADVAHQRRDLFGLPRAPRGEILVGSQARRRAEERERRRVSRIRVGVGIEVVDEAHVVEMEAVDRVGRHELPADVDQVRADFGQARIQAHVEVRSQRLARAARVEPMPFGMRRVQLPRVRRRRGPTPRRHHVDPRVELHAERMRLTARDVERVVARVDAAEFVGPGLQCRTVVRDAMAARLEHHVVEAGVGAVADRSLHVCGGLGVEARDPDRARGFVECRRRTPGRPWQCENDPAQRGASDHRAGSRAAVRGLPRTSANTNANNAPSGA